MKFFAAICLLTIATAYQFAKRHNELDIHKRAPFESNLFNRLLPRSSKSSKSSLSSPRGATRRVGSPPNSSNSGPSSSNEQQQQPAAVSKGEAASSSRSSPNKQRGSPLQGAKSLDISKSGGHSAANSPGRARSMSPPLMDSGPRNELRRESSTGSVGSAYRISSGRSGLGISRLPSGAVHPDDGHVQNAPDSPRREASRSLIPPGTVSSSAVGMNVPSMAGPDMQQMSRTTSPGRGGSVLSRLDREDKNLVNCAVLGTCAIGAGIAMVAAGTGPLQAAGIAALGSGGGLAIGSAGVLGHKVFSSRRDVLSGRPGQNPQP